MPRVKPLRQNARSRRHARVRARVSGTATRPRLSVFRSLKGVYVQLIDDVSCKTLAAVHSRTVKPSAPAPDRAAKVAASYCAGMAIAEMAKAKKIEAVVFDRGGYAYHGRVKAVADGAREGGLKF